MSDFSDRRIPVLVLTISAAIFLVPACIALGIAVAFGGSAGRCGEGTRPASKVKGVPAGLIPVYRQAATRYGLGERGPAILAGINWEETGFGTNLGVSSAAAEGWMQFLPESWRAFGVDADGDGRKDPYDPVDAIFAAARLLRYSGAPHDWHAAIYSYNHAEWYVRDVLADARKWAAIGSLEAGVCSAAPPTERIAQMIAEADRLSSIRPQTEYTWGGSHGVSPTPPNGPFDCSSAVSHLLQVGGFGNPTMTTVGLAQWGERGPGRWLTILVKPFGPDAHTVIEFMPGLTPPEERFWGTSGFVEPGHGPGWIPESTFDAGYLAGFQLRHPRGM